ncbi:hypothetical protein NQ317_013212 [Molorchus minor]|uniref:Trehalase n=1 Tax=Molorchus minor TaxID=1323400 RepID=A0ABQ9J4W3_9CUCU|nr:hypothetical protein NQ317_013212 [Molorchus minor]
MKQLTVLIAVFSYRVSCDTIQSCESLIYCQGKLLDTVQKARVFDDSKTFVDMIQRNPANVTLANFENLMDSTDDHPTDEEVTQFVTDNFVSEGELEDWSPADYKNNPKFLKKIEDIVVRDFARTLVSIWPSLARKVKPEVTDNPDRHSLIPVPNGFMVPGGRFKELYYWDSYWIIKGLLLSEMTDTARGMLENFLSLVQRFGFVPNGSRIYYLNRSQPPLLSLMAGLYVEATKDVDWLEKNIDTLESELKWWLNNRVIDIERDGVKYTLAHYASESGTPRPESYYEDIRTCAVYGEEEKENCYQNLKSGAESGWDFSSRWIFDPKGGTNSNLTHVEAKRVIPVDLNSYLCKAFKQLSVFYELLGDADKAIQWLEKSSSWQKSIELVLYDRTDGIWYDYDSALQQPRKLFFPSNFAPLWAGSYDVSLSDEYGSRAARYFTDTGIMDYTGGIPTSLDQSGEQWDYPNAWPPLQEIVVLGLKQTGNEEAAKIAETFARRWVDANIRGYNSDKVMFEKYDAVHSGQYGGGGEYTVQSGFGWSNGVALSLINNFYVEGDNKSSKARRR